MPDPAVSAETGDAFEQGQAAMAANGSWNVATFDAAGFDYGVAPLPSGPAGRFTSVNPTGAVVYKSSKAPDAAWEFVKYLASPAAQEQLMTLKASMPVNKEVLAGPYSSSWDGAKVFADSLTYAKLKPSFKGYDEFTTTLQEELDTNVFNAANKTAKDALGDGGPAAQRDPRGPVADDGPAVPARRRRPRTAAEGAARRRGLVGAAVPGAHAPRPRAALGRADPRLVRHQPHVVGPAAAAAVRRPRQLRQPRQRPAVPRLAAEHRDLHAALGPDRAGAGARPCAGAQRPAARDRADPDRLLPPRRHLGDRRRPGLVLDLQPRRAGC